MTSNLQLDINLLYLPIFICIIGWFFQLFKKSLKDLINPEKSAKKRHRDGYEDHDYTLHHSQSILKFVSAQKESEAIIMLSKYNQFTWDAIDLDDVRSQ